MHFACVAKFTGNLAFEEENYIPSDTTLRDAMRVWTHATGEVPVVSDPGDSEYSYLAEEAYYYHHPEWFQGLQDVEVSGILTRAEFDRFIDGIGAFAEDVGTLGTLGGPLSLGMVPDISFCVESEFLFSCIRVTPLPSRVYQNKSTLPVTDRMWDRIRTAVLRVYGP